MRKLVGGSAREVFSDPDLLWKDGKCVVDVSMYSHHCKSTSRLHKLFSLRASD